MATNVTYYCWVCQRATSDEIPPLHRHITRFYSGADDTFWFQMSGGTLKTLEAFVAQQAPASQVIIEGPSYALQDVRDHEELSRLFKACRKALALPDATLIEMLKVFLARQGVPDGHEDLPS